MLFVLLGGYYYIDVEKQLYMEMSTRAKIQAEEIAIIPYYGENVAKKDIPRSSFSCMKIAAHSGRRFY